MNLEGIGIDSGPLVVTVLETEGLKFHDTQLCSFSVITFLQWNRCWLALIYMYLQISQNYKEHYCMSRSILTEPQHSFRNRRFIEVRFLTTIRSITNLLELQTFFLFFLLSILPSPMTKRVCFLQDLLAFSRYIN